jgi:hypothetical protein
MNCQHITKNMSWDVPICNHIVNPKTRKTQITEIQFTPLPGKNSQQFRKVNTTTNKPVKTNKQAITIFTLSSFLVFQ